MAITLLRVDERLIHGQVTVGWGGRLRPTVYVVVDDKLVVSDWERELMELGAPPEVEVEFLSVAAARLRVEEWSGSSARVVVLTRDLDHMIRLARGRILAGEQVNLGGLHHAPGRTEALPYLFLTQEDRELIVELEAEGAEVSARDLPTSPRRSVKEIFR